MSSKNSDILFSNICSMENLYHAWNKAKHIYEYESDFVYIRKELSEFEADLQNKLNELAERLRNEKFALTPMIPMPLPKSSDGKVESRQNFHIALEDQIVWLAVINVLGPLLDDNMKFWSFGSRLYMPIWKEDIDEAHPGEKVTRYGSYRVASTKIYRSWTSSWPLFRKAVAITAKAMLDGEFDEDEQEEIENNLDAPECVRIITWNKGYWNKRQKQDKDIYYATIDLKKFYPCIDAKSILNNTVLQIIGITPESKNQNKLYTLLDKLLSYYIDGDYLNLSDEDSPLVPGDRDGDKYFGIPTGLFVAGFLANMAMLEIDEDISNELDRNRRVAHFRYVDDHVILAYSIEDLGFWIEKYALVVERYLKRVSINEEKIEPAEFKDYFINEDKNERIRLISIAEMKCRIDPQIASPFTTLTLKKLSGINKSPFELFDETEKIQLLQDVEHILVTEFPDEEIRKDTRVSWAASLLSRVVPEIDFNINDIISQRAELESLYCSREEAAQREDENDTMVFDEKIGRLEADVHCLEVELAKRKNNLFSRVFQLLLRALTENISKPKIWKKCVTFCRATGYEGIDRLFKQLTSANLSDAGKKYIFYTLVNELSDGMLKSLVTVKSNEYSHFEKDRADKFVAYIKRIFNVITDESEKYEVFYDQEILKQFKVALHYYCIECEKETPTKQEYDYTYFCYLWNMMTRTAGVFTEQQPISLNNGLAAMDKIYSDRRIIEKLAQMYSYRPIVFANANARHPQPQISLSEWITNNKTESQKVKANGFDMLSSEWVSLAVTLKAIKVVEDKIKLCQSSNFSFDNHPTVAEFINCAPENFDIGVETEAYNSMREVKSWEKLTVKLKEINLHYFKRTDDIRYDYSFYNQYGYQVFEKRQVFSLVILMIAILSNEQKFSPFLNRRDPIDRNYQLLLEKISNTSISSYTRAIIIGALSYREFERNTFSSLDFSGRYDGVQNEPIVVESICDLKSHIEDAKKTLEDYRLSLEKQVPRQLIPISLVNMSRTYNPYSNGGDDGFGVS